MTTVNLAADCTEENYLKAKSESASYPLNLPGGECWLGWSRLSLPDETFSIPEYHDALPFNWGALGADSYRYLRPAGGATDFL